MQTVSFQISSIATRQSYDGMAILLVGFKGNSTKFLLEPQAIHVYAITVNILWNLDRFAVDSQAPSKRIRKNKPVPTIKNFYLFGTIADRNNRIPCLFGQKNHPGLRFKSRALWTVRYHRTRSDAFLKTSDLFCQRPDPAPSCRSTDRLMSLFFHYTGDNLAVFRLTDNGYAVPPLVQITDQQESRMPECNDKLARGYDGPDS